MLLGIVGLNGSGKDSVAHYLIKKHNFLHKDLGQEIRDELKRLGKDFLNRTEMINLGNEKRKEFGADYWAKRALENYSPESNFIITSVRNPSEAELIKSKRGFIIEVFAEQNVRYDRTILRVKNDSNAHGDVVSFDEFKKKEELELTSTDPSKQQLLACIKMASHRIDNNGSLEELSKKIDLLLEELMIV